MFICLTFVKWACFVLYSTCVGFDLMKSPEVTLCGCLGYKPSINKSINKSSSSSFITLPPLVVVPVVTVLVLLDLVLVLLLSSST